MSQSGEPPARREMRTATRKLGQRVRDLNLDEFNLQQLSSLGIRFEPLALSDPSQSGPTFFAPLPENSMPVPDDNALGRAYKGVDGDPSDPLLRQYYTSCPNDRSNQIWRRLQSYISHCHRVNKATKVPWTSGCPGDYSYAGLYKYEEPDYGCYNVTNIDDPAYPHVKAIMYNNMVASDSSLLRGELLPALRIMVEHLKKSKYIQHWVSPIMMISLMGFNVRVLEIYYSKSNSRLVVRHSEMFDFTHGNNEAFKILAQWYLGNPIGDTVCGA